MRPSSIVLSSVCAFCPHYVFSQRPMQNDLGSSLIILQFQPNEQSREIYFLSVVCPLPNTTTWFGYLTWNQLLRPNNWTNHPMQSPSQARRFESNKKQRNLKPSIFLDKKNLIMHHERMELTKFVPCIFCSNYTNQGI